MQPLEGKVATVAGATRGAGRGIARMSGEAGATVYCTGRSTRTNPSDYNRPETLGIMVRYMPYADRQIMNMAIDNVKKGLRMRKDRLPELWGWLKVVEEAKMGGRK